jgi:hypothetical protein
LRTLKPNAAEDAAKSKHEFIMVAMVAGIIGLVFCLVAFFAALALLPKLIDQWMTQHPNEYPANAYYPPGPNDCPDCGSSSMPSAILNPSSGPVGTQVTINSQDILNATHTVLMNGDVAAENVTLTDQGTLTFTIPSTLRPVCHSDICPQFVAVVKPGDYDISIEDDVFGNFSVGTFTVTTSGIVHPSTNAKLY